MNNVIALIDDRADQRGTLRGHIEEALPEGWAVLDIAPHDTLTDAVAWIMTNRVAVLLLDERLDEAAQAGVEYAGHQLAASVRAVVPEMPIFVVTSWTGDDVLSDNGEVLDNVIQRKDFGKEAHIHVARFVRAATRFLATHARQLNELSDLAIKVANGVATPDELTRLRVLQTALGLTRAFDPFIKQAEVLDEAEQLAKQLETSLKAAAASLARKPPRKPATTKKKAKHK